jgi:hypothetical protein
LFLCILIKIISKISEGFWMTIKFKLATLTSLLCANAFAAPVYQPPGPSLTFGSTSNNQSVMSSTANPAASLGVLNKENSLYRFGIISVGGGYEVGNVNDLANQIDATKTLLTNARTFTEPLGATPQQIADDLNALLITPVNSSLSALQKDGNASIYFDGHVPFTPFVFSKSKFGGSFVFDANFSAIANASFIAQKLTPLNATNLSTYASVNSGTGVVTYTAPPNSNDSTLLVKAAMVSELGLGYSRSVLKRESTDFSAGEMSADKLKAGELTAGVRLKYYQVKLANKAQRQQSTAAGGAQSTLKASQTYTSSSGLGLDVGTLWTGRRYRVGTWINNLNKPGFKYSAIDLAGYTNPDVISQLNGSATYVMKPQLQMEGAIFTESQNWLVNAGLDANAIKDPVGRDFQWATLSAAYATFSVWVPETRIGYRANLAGSKLRYISGGMTILKVLSLDAAYALNSVKDNSGRSIPRSAMINLNLQMPF